MQIWTAAPHPSGRPMNMFTVHVTFPAWNNNEKKFYNIETMLFSIEINIRSKKAQTF